MSQPIEVDDQETVPPVVDTQHDEEDNPKMSSEADHKSDSAQSKNSTKSLSPSFLQQVDENGRQYCNQTYHMPADDAEQTRLHISHQLYLTLLSSSPTLSHIPPTTTRILDLGTGPADWPTHIASLHPLAEITATDITTYFQPPTAPPNVFFELDDAQQEWAYGEGFELIHVRGLGGAFADWGAVYGQVGRGLRVGGSVEVSDCGWIRMEEGWESGCLRRYNELVKAAAEKAGRPLGLDHLDGRYFERAGLHVVKSKTFDVPLGVWAREPQRRVAGKMALIVALEGLEATGLRLLVREMGLGVQEVKELCGGVRREVEGGRAFVPYSFVVARKLVMG